MSLNRILYIYEGILGEKYANSIQASSMVSAFSENSLKTYVICRGIKSDYKAPRNVEIIKFNSRRIWVYRVKVITYILLARIPRVNLVFGRSFFIQTITGVFGHKSILELHKDESLISGKKCLIQLSHRNVVFLGISESIFNSLIWRSKAHFVLHDGHSNPINFISVPSHKDKIQIGYFGQLAKRKGLSILKHIDSLLPSYCDLNIYSPQIELFHEFINLSESRFLRHEEVFNKMKQMDILLLPIAKVEDNDYSAYTSPLKLFEYASAGRFVLYTPTRSLAELNLPENFLSCNSEEDWIKAIDFISQKDYGKIQKSSVKWASNYTWDSRVKSILSHANI